MERKACTVGNGEHTMLFIIEGSTTFLAAIGGIFLLPDTPGKTRWLTAEKNTYTAVRLEEDNMNELKHETLIQGLVSALKDYKVWLFMFMQNMRFSAMSFNQFFPTIVKTLGYDRTIKLVLTSPPYVFAAMFALAPYPGPPDGSTSAPGTFMVATPLLWLALL
ncbi:MFS transporter prlL [Colletotrichum siamense]|uniref:MFS transporter prlL n=1 Tax=Colletotrichum siamense TaxID=690259 RepID=A0A9P5BS53_COLSI|nr:MFS transporter prlL [Colletotrichum siamense]KAF4848295.1 MFS transporter prlL [Colletotrichum siamense]